MIIIKILHYKQFKIFLKDIIFYFLKYLTIFTIIYNPEAKKR